MGKVFSNLNLNGHTSARVQPKVGAWGPQVVPSTGMKKFTRVFAWVAFFLALAALLGYATFMYLNYFGPNAGR